jgi:hypothetical protein
LEEHRGYAVVVHLAFDARQDAGHIVEQVNQNLFGFAPLNNYRLNSRSSTSLSNRHPLLPPSLDLLRSASVHGARAAAYDPSSAAFTSRHALS